MAAARRPSPAVRVLAWLYTGPLGHLYGGVADVAELLARATWGKVARRGDR